MNRRNFIGMIAIGGSVSKIPNLMVVGEEDAEGTSPLAWLRDEPLIIAGNWASTAIFRRRVGGYPTWHDAEFDQQQATEETVRRLKDLGITMVVTHFFTGFGLEAEKEHIGLARELSNILKPSSFTLQDIKLIEYFVIFDRFLFRCSQLLTCSILCTIGIQIF